LVLRDELDPNRTSEIESPMGPAGLKPPTK